MKDSKSLPLGWQLAHIIGSAEAEIVSGGVAVVPAGVDCKYFSGGLSYGGHTDGQVDWGIDF